MFKRSIVLVIFQVNHLIILTCMAIMLLKLYNLIKIKVIL